MIFQGRCSKNSVASMMTLVFGYFLLKERGMCLSIFSLEGHFKRGDNSCSMKEIHDVKIDETSDYEIPNSMPRTYVFNPSQSRRSVKVNS